MRVMNTEAKQNTISLNVKGLEISEDEEWQYLRFKNVSDEDIIPTLKTIYDYENIPNHKNIALDFKFATTEQKIIALRYSMSREDLHDDYMITNVFNLLKFYNNLNKEYFDSPYTYANDANEMTTFKKELRNELKEMKTKLSWYLLCLMKSYNKTAYTTQDTHIELPLIYQVMILGSDFMTLFGIFAMSNPINTDSLVYIDNAFMFLNALLSKSGTMGMMLNDYLQELENNGTLVPEREE